jgi:DNA-binding transcriptional LysR family regulator
VLLPALVRQLRAEAPGAELRVRPIGPAIVEDLDAGRVELVLGGFERVPERFASAPLFRDTMVWALGRDHPAAALPLSLERLVELPQLIVATGEDEHAVRGVVLDHGVERRVLRDDAEALAAALAARGLRRRVTLTVPNGPIAARIAADGDVAALLPRRIAAAHTDRLALFEPPYPAPPFEIAMLWHRRLGDEPALDWLRGLLHRVAAAL